MSLAFKRVYVDIPPDVHERLQALARERGMTQKALIASLITAAAQSTGKAKKGAK